MRRHDVDHCMNIQVFWWSFSNKGWPAPRIPTHTKIPTCKQLCPQIGVRSQSFFGGLGLMSAPKRKQWKKQRQRNWERERERKETESAGFVFGQRAAESTSRIRTATWLHLESAFPYSHRHQKLQHKKAADTCVPFYYPAKPSSHAAISVDNTSRQTLASQVQQQLQMQLQQQQEIQRQLRTSLGFVSFLNAVVE